MKLNVSNSGGSYKPPKRRKVSRPKKHTGSANAVEHHVYPKKSHTTSRPRPRPKPKPRRVVHHAPKPKPRRRVTHTSSRSHYVKRVATKKHSAPKHHAAPKKHSAPKPKARPAPKPKPKPKPKPPNANQYLGQDTTYQSQLAQLRKAYTDYVAGQNNEKANYGNTYALNKRNLGTDRTQAFTGLKDDYASRGVLQSGLYGKAFADTQNDYSQRQAALDTNRSAFLGDLGVNLKTFQGDQATTLTSARQEALARRAAKYNLRV